MADIELVIKVSEELACEGFERLFTEEEKNILIKAIGNGIPHETVTEFADRCRECGAKYGKLLKQESCKDAVNRQWLMECVNEGWIKFDTEKDRNIFIHLVRDIAPPVTLQQPKMGWTPVSEGLPEEGKTVIASTKYGVYPETRYTKEYGWEWAYEAGADYWRELEYVEAWMPLPKRYEPQESEDKE